MIFEIKILFTGLLVIFAAVLNSQMDIIRLNPSESWFPNWNYWIKNNWRANWLMKTILSIFLDGWHTCKSLMIFCFSFAISIYQVWYYGFIYYALFGLFFEIGYNYLRNTSKSGTDLTEIKFETKNLTIK